MLAIGDHPANAETASKLQAAAEKVEKHQAEEMAASELWATADTLQPRHSTVEAYDAADNLSIENVASEHQALQIRENLSPGKTKNSQASLDASRSSPSNRPRDCTSSETVTSPIQETQPRGSIDKFKVDWVEAEEAKESGGYTSLSMAVNQQRGFVNITATVLGQIIVEKSSLHLLSQQGRQKLVGVGQVPAQEEALL